MGYYPTMNIKRHIRGAARGFSPNLQGKRAYGNSPIHTPLPDRRPRDTPLQEVGRWAGVGPRRVSSPYSTRQHERKYTFAPGKLFEERGRGS